MGIAKQDVKAAVAIQPRHSEAFKRDAVRLVIDEGYTFAAAAQAVGVSDQTLRTWRKKFGPAPHACGEDATLDELRAQSRRHKQPADRGKKDEPDGSQTRVEHGDSSSTEMSCPAARTAAQQCSDATAQDVECGPKRDVRTGPLQGRHVCAVANAGPATKRG